ncbi:MAG: Hsp20/alpha crystallin family protein [Gammaproteobacteria bacterium]|jgi:HSP20 family protein|nr:Hsp20/alpha crystallin family protein [Gammaproteobacteria bacterium]
MSEANAENKDVVTRENSEVQKQQESEIVLRAPVDIYENAEGITLLADMPGVNKDSLSLQVDKDSLIVEGEARIDMPEGMEALYADVRSTRYQRSFALSGELETDRIEASLKDGVLRVHIPKRAEARPRKIEIHTG